MNLNRIPQMAKPSSNGANTQGGGYRVHRKKTLRAIRPYENAILLSSLWTGLRSITDSANIRGVWAITVINVQIILITDSRMAR